MLIHWITRSFWPRLWSAANKWLEDDGPTWAASLGYYAAFSFFPVILLLLSVAGFVLRFSRSVQLQKDQLVELIGQQTSKDLAVQIGKVAGGVQVHALLSGPVGLATLIFAAIGIFTQLEAAFDRIWHIEIDPHQSSGLWATIVNALYVRLRAFLMLLGTWALVLVAFIASLVVAAISHLAKDVPLGPPLLRAVSMSVSAGLNILCFALLYRFLPKRRVLWRHAIGGALVAGIAWEIGRQLLALFLIGGSYSAYGVVGSLIVLMLWCYYGSLVLLFGAEFVEINGRMYEMRREAATPAGKETTAGAKVPES
jgi:membrane protein